jgi:hypothetical protein
LVVSGAVLLRAGYGRGLQHEQYLTSLLKHVLPELLEGGLAKQKVKLRGNWLGFACINGVDQTN